MKAESFQGFSTELIDFLWELRFNNYKEWFHGNRDRYVSLLKDPLRSFGQDMCVELKEKLGVDFIPAVSRINRDVRFSKNKEPYRDHMWVVFKQDVGTWKDKPCMYFEFGVDYYIIGIGLYDSSPKHMKVFRDIVDANVPAFERLIKPYGKNKDFEPRGDCYKRIDAGDKSAEVLNWYSRKILSVSKTQPLSPSFYTRDLIEDCAKDYEFLLPMLKFLEKVKI